MLTTQEHRLLSELRESGKAISLLFFVCLIGGLVAVAYYSLDFGHPPIDVLRQPSTWSGSALPAQNSVQIPVGKVSSPFPSEQLVYRLEVVNAYPHDPKAYTQGLLYLGKDTLYESTGLRGKSSVRKVDLKTGKVLQSTALPGTDFGEGLAYYRGYFWQLIWQSRKVYKYHPETLKRLKSYQMPSLFDFSDGWGLASSSDGIGKLYSPGSVPKKEVLYVTDSGTKMYEVELRGDMFQLVRKVTIKTRSRKPLEMANELELISPKEMWANIYGKDCIARLNPHDGRIFGYLLGDDLRRQAGRFPEVFNGIAYDREGKRLFVTGKLWSKLFEVRLVPTTLPDSRLDKMCIPKRNIFNR